jgi:hydroxymethylpyrimidine/phosphomethylpyrimidine kinase
MKKALTIAGSDCGGGAGIQADLKTFSALGVYGMSVITAVTAQNTLGVFGVGEVSLPLIASQIDAVVTDIGTDAAKTGMLSSASIIEIVAQKIREHQLAPLIVDPMMIAKSGDALLAPEAVKTLKEQLIPLATLLTPNIPEAEVLTGMQIRTEAQMQEAAKKLSSLGCQAVLIKGGHLKGDACDLLYDGTSYYTFRAKRIEQKHTHGTGCTLSAAIASLMAKQRTLFEAVEEAKAYISAAIEDGLAIGRGIGPVNHFHALYKENEND